MQIYCKTPFRIPHHGVYASFQEGYDGNWKRAKESHKISTISHLTYQERHKCLGLACLEYRREGADLVEVFKIMNDNDNVDKEKIFTVSTYTATRGHTLKFAKKRHRLKVRSNSFSIWVIDSWNALPESVIMALSLSCFKSRLNSHWNNHPYKFDLWCYIPRPKPRDYYQNAPTEAV